MKQKILHILLSAVLAFGIWAYVVTVVSPESEATYYNIPVVLQNESILTDKGLMVISNKEPTVTLQLRGNRSDLNKLKNSDITIVADLAKIHSAGEQSLNVDVSFGGTNAFEIVKQQPTQIVLQIAEWASKEIPVKVNYTGILGLNYIAYEDEAVLDRQSITITGPKSAVDQIAQACIDVDLTDCTETISESYRYTLCNANGDPVDASSIKTNAAEVSLTLKIQRVKEVQLLLDVHYGGGATGETTSIVQDYQTIKVAGSEKMLNSLGDVIKIGTINLADVPEETTLTFPLTLPEGIENLTGIEEVNVTITFPGLATRTIYVSRIYPTTPPQGMVADIASKVVSVTVRGPKKLVDEMDSIDLWITIDLSQAVLGENRYKAQVWVDDAFSEVGVLGSYNIVVSLTEIDGGTQ